MTRTLNELLEAHFGLKTSYRINPEVTQVETTVTKVLSYNPNRLGLVIVNNGTANIFLSPLNTVTLGNGIRLVPAGGSITLKWDVDFELVSSEFFGIADGAASAIYLIEIYTL